MAQTEHAFERHFTQPYRQILTMLIVLALVGAGAYVAYPQVAPVFLANPWLNGFIGFVFVIGVLACFSGLATTVPAVVDTIRSLAPQEGDTGVAVFERLMSGLEAQLGGMGVAFASSLLGLAGSLVVGLLELFASHGQNRFYRELEEWLSTITRLGFAGDEGGSSLDHGAISQMTNHMTERLDGMQAFYADAADRQAVADEQLGELANGVRLLSDRLAGSGDTDGEGAGMPGAQFDPESRMRLRSMDVQMLRILEEISAGRQESIGELRSDIAQLTQAIRALGRTRADSEV
jgi:hypothetical protein